METTVEQVVTAIEQLVSAARTEGYLEGYKAALKFYAWWKDGVQYVGCGVRTLKEVLDGLEKGGN